MAKWLMLTMLMASAASAKEAEPHHWLSFVPGSFALVGQGPGGGAAYAGEAKIEARGGDFFLRRTVGGATVEAKGKIEIPQPPGEGEVLRFRWQEKGAARVMTCLVASDLDNYARLSCLWTAEGGAPSSPGLEAYFAKDAWPQE